MGMDRSEKLSYHSTVSTWGTAAIFSFSEMTSLPCMFSTMIKEKAPLPKIFQQKILAGDRVHAVRQIVEHIVVDARSLHADDRRNEKHQRSDQNRYVKLDNKFPKFP